jgi:transcriptional regulator with XRE-family HTH domain
MSAEKKRVGARLREERMKRTLTVEALAEAFRDAASERDRRRLPAQKDLRRMIRGYEAGEHMPGPDRRMLYCVVFDMVEAELFGSGQDGQVVPASAPTHDDEIEALELARRATASDVGTDTLQRLEMAVDDLAISYHRTPPAELLDHIRRHLAYVADLIDARKTLAEHQRLLVVGGWLSLLGATCHVDLHQRDAATARLRTAAGLARETGHAEIAGWCLETEAWQALTDGDYRQAVMLSQGAQAIAPTRSSAYIQASAQEGRAWARLGATRETRTQLDRVAALTGNLAAPDRPEHHYRYDPAKADAYTATTLAWLGDPAAEPYARQVLARMEAPSNGRIRARRVASARLDLSLTLIAADQPEEATHETLTAVTSGVLVPSNYWRAGEIIGAVEAAHVPEVTELREAYREFCGPADYSRPSSLH